MDPEVWLSADMCGWVGEAGGRGCGTLRGCGMLGDAGRCRDAGCCGMLQGCGMLWDTALGEKFE